MVKPVNVKPRIPTAHSLVGTGGNVLNGPYRIHPIYRGNIKAKIHPRGTRRVVTWMNNFPV